MNQLVVSLPEKANVYVSTQAKVLGYANAGEYIKNLIYHDQEQQQSSLTALRKALEKGEASGISQRSLEEIRKSALTTLGL